MKRCNGFTEDHEICQVGAEFLCARHENYYDHWFEKHPPLYGFFHFDELSSYPPMLEYCYQFSNGFVVPSKKYVYNLTNTPSHYFYYAFMAAYSGPMDPLWNKSIFRDSVLFYFMRAINRKAYLEEFLEVVHFYAKNTEAIYFMMDCLLKKSCEILLETDYKIDHILDSIWTELLDLRFTKDILYSVRLETIVENNLSVVEYLKDFFEPIFQRFKERSKEDIRGALGNYKEELYAAAWHPRRVESWLEYYGDELFDKI